MSDLNDFLKEIFYIHFFLNTVVLFSVFFSFSLREKNRKHLNQLALYMYMNFRIRVLVFLAIYFDLFTKKEEKNKGYCYAYEIVNTG